MSPQRLQRHNVKGWRKPVGAVYVGPRTRWENPFRVVRIKHGAWRVTKAGEELPQDFSTRQEAHASAVDHFRRFLGRDPLGTRELAGKDLVCWCPLDGPCHGDVLLEIANKTADSLRVFDGFLQGSSEWEDARRGLVTASTVGQLITPKTVKPAANDKQRTLVFQLVAERLTGRSEETFQSHDMERGVLDEPYARDLYADHTGQAVDQVGFITWDDGLIQVGYSPDGLVGDDGLIEIKSRRPKDQVRTILNDTVPEENMAQLQCGLLVSGRAWIDYVSYCGGMPLYIKRVEPDERWFNAIRHAVSAFEETAAAHMSTYQTRTEGLPVAPLIDHFPEIAI